MGLRVFLQDCLRGISVLTALGGLALALLGVHALLPLGVSAADPAIAWFGQLLVALGALVLCLGLAAGMGPACSRSAPLHCVSRAGLVASQALHHRYLSSLPIRLPPCPTPDPS